MLRAQPTPVGGLNFNVSNPTIGQVLTYQNGQWINSNVSGTGTVTSVTAGTGLSGGTITSSGTINLTDTAVTTGTYGDGTHVAQITIDQQGRITGVTSVAISGGGSSGFPITLGSTSITSSSTTTTITGLTLSSPTLTGTITGLPVSSNSVFGVAKVDNTTVVANTGVLSVGATVGQIVRETFSTTSQANSGFNVEDQTGSLSGAITRTLALCTTYTAGARVIVEDISGTVTGSNTISVAPHATSGGETDTINGSTSAQFINSAYGYLIISTDGVSKWTVVGAVGSVSGVSSITGTANEINASASTGAVTLSIPSNAVLPGSPTTTTPSVNDSSTKIATTAMVNPGTGALGTVTTSTTVNWAASTGYSFTLTASDACTVTFSNATTDNETITVVVTGASGASVVWPTVAWAAGTAPTQSASNDDFYTFKKVGSKIYGSVVQNMH